MEYIFGVVGLIAFLYVLISVLKNKKIKAMGKAIWIVAGLIFSVITAIVYYVKHEK